MTLKAKKITQKQACKLYPIYSEAWFERARWAGTGPKFQRIGRRVFYDVDELEKFFNAPPLVSSTAEYTEVQHGS